MKALKSIKQLMFMLAVLGLTTTPRLNAQTFTLLHSFTAGGYTNSDGENPYLAGLILSSNTLYGTTSLGGSSGKGTLFAVNTDGTGFTNLYSFAGANPSAGLILSGNTLYGTAFFSGVFAINTDGTGYTNLYSLIGSYATLILSGNTLFGTTYIGGSSGIGSVFSVSTNGTDFMPMYSFTDGNDGAYPDAGLILSGNTLYGTTRVDGSSGFGNVFAINTDRTGFTNLYSFNGSDGKWPYANLILSGNTLYGTTYYGGSSGNGTVFAISTNGTDFTNLYSFGGTNDGANPYAGLIVSGKTLYGTASGGGSFGQGTLFAIDTNGKNFTNLYSFTATLGPNPSTNSDGASPQSSLILSGNTLYGTTYAGGSSGFGTVFSFLFAPKLNLILSGTNVILTWTNNATGFTLEFTTNLVPPAIWTTNLTAPVVVSGQYTVTNPISGTQQFYRLSQSPP
jgi:uncharacterized repeat protein (TIGR03803 family)